MSIQAVLIDDEEDGRNVLRTLLEKFCPEISICGEAGNVQQAYEVVKLTKPEVIFLDIQMPGGSGFNLLKKLGDIPFEVIFVTSYDKYAIEAIKFSALDYLLKPIAVEELIIAVEKLTKSLRKKHTKQLQFTNAINQIENREIEKKLAVHHNEKVFLIALSDVTHMEGERNYTVIHTGNAKYTSSKNLGEFEDMLEVYSNFMRISKSCLVNLNHVSSYTKGAICVLTISEDCQFEISRRKKQEFLDRIE